MNGGSIAAGLAALLVLGQGISAAVKGSSELLRPPGSQGESDFMSRCIKCGKCAEACKYAAIKMASVSGAATGTPYIDARVEPCHLCEDFPCVAACPTGALRDVEAPETVNMGYAVIDENLCIAFEGMRCEVCYRACPLIDSAITLSFEQREGDSIHAKFIPVIHKAKCTGCGLCVQRCVVDTPRVAISICSIAEQQNNFGTVVQTNASGNSGNGNGNGNGSGNGAGNGSGNGSGNGNKNGTGNGKNS